MAQFEVTIFTHESYAVLPFTAEMAEDALAQANALLEEYWDSVDPESVIDFERYDDAGQVEGITIRDANGDDVLRWTAPERKAQDAAPDLLKTLRDVEAFLDGIEGHANGIEDILAQVRASIATATATG